MFISSLCQTTKKIPKVCVTVLCEGNPALTSRFRSQRHSNAERNSESWRHHAICECQYWKLKRWRFYFCLPPQTTGNVSWASVGPTSVLSSQRWANADNLQEVLTRDNKANLRDLVAATGLVISNAIQIDFQPLKFDRWPRKTIGDIYHAPRSHAYHFISLHEFKLELLSRNAQIGAKSSIFRLARPWNVTDDLEKCVLTSVTFDLWPWPFTWTSLLPMAITPDFMMMRWEEHCEKRCHRRTNGHVFWKVYACFSAEPLQTRLYPLIFTTCNVLIQEYLFHQKANFVSHDYHQYPLVTLTLMVLRVRRQAR